MRRAITRQAKQCIDWHQNTAWVVRGLGQRGSDATTSDLPRHSPSTGLHTAAQRGLADEPACPALPGCWQTLSLALPSQRTRAIIETSTAVDGQAAWNFEVNLHGTRTVCSSLPALRFTNFVSRCFVPLDASARILRRELWLTNSRTVGFYPYVTHL